MNANATLYQDGTIEIWARQDSNLRSKSYELPALTTELRALVAISHQLLTTPLKANGCPLPRAGDGIRTRGYQLGRLTPYHLATPACGRNFTTENRGLFF